MRLRTFAVAAFALLASCIADLEGGAPRVQLRNVWSDTVVAIRRVRAGVGDFARIE